MVNLARAAMLSLWASAVVLVSVPISSIAAPFLVLDRGVPTVIAPFLFGGLAVTASAVGALVARLFPAVRAGYPWSRLTFAGVFGWATAIWAGLETMRTLESARPEGMFAISVSLNHASIWNGGIALVALLVLLLPIRVATPGPREGSEA